MKIERIYAIDTMGNYPIALVRYEGCSPAWRQYHNNKVNFILILKGE